MNINRSYALVNSTTTSNSIYSIPLTAVLLQRMNMKTLSGIIYVNVHLNSNPVSSSSNGGILTLNSVSLRVIAARKNPVLESQIVSLYQNNPTLLIFTYPHIANFNQQLTTGANNDLDNTNGGTTAFVSISGTDASENSGSIDLLDVNKQTLLGNGASSGK